MNPPEFKRLGWKISGLYHTVLLLKKNPTFQSKAWPEVPLKLKAGRYEDADVQIHSSKTCLWHYFAISKLKIQFPNGKLWQDHDYLSFKMKLYY